MGSGWAAFFEIEMVVQTAPGIERRATRWALVVGFEILIDRELVAARAAHHRAFRPLVEAPCPGGVRFPVAVTVYARIPPITARHPDRNDVERAVPMRAATVGVERRSVHRDAMDMATAARSIGVGG